uniref:Putative secreted peptide n=1 Tax=Anopheles braziliensis TaxID=58242 RepID=A0A2M3ZP64_9DIPT
MLMLLLLLLLLRPSVLIAVHAVQLEGRTYRADGRDDDFRLGGAGPQQGRVFRRIVLILDVQLTVLVPRWRVRIDITANVQLLFLDIFLLDVLFLVVLLVHHDN